MASAPALPGLDLNEGAAYAPGGKDGGRAVSFGQADAGDSTLLPEPFRKALGLAAGEVPERTAVKLGPDDLQAYRYEGLEPAGSSRRVTVYASPTSEGVATVACLAPPADAGAFKRRVRGDRRHAPDRVRQAVPGRSRPRATRRRSARRSASSTARSRRAARRSRATRRRSGRRPARRGTSRTRTSPRRRSCAARMTSPADTLINASLVGPAPRGGRRVEEGGLGGGEEGQGRLRPLGGRDQADAGRSRPALAGLERIGYKVSNSAAVCEQSHGSGPAGVRCFTPRSRLTARRGRGKVEPGCSLVSSSSSPES